ncbi:MAG: ATP-binding cassette domain-containing protein [Bacteroidales bacterium]|nr:ATP-binding cassette domain-containing protein [Bacteroidales bacterium]
MQIILRNLKPTYMSEPEVAGSDLYLQPEVRFVQGRKYLIRAKSGHGKTSLLNFIYGTSNAYDGQCCLDPTPDPARLRTHLLSYMFQDLCLFPQLTALENVMLKNRLTDYKSASQIEAMLDALLPADKKHQPVATLSLGQRQRVAAVRALCQPMCFLLMDEPFSHIDSQNAHLMAGLILGEVQAQQAGLIVTALDPTDYFPFDTQYNL